MQRGLGVLAHVLLVCELHHVVGLAIDVEVLQAADEAVPVRSVTMENGNQFCAAELIEF